MTIFYLIRHGQDEDNVRHILNGHRDLPLTELGREQAAKSSDQLLDKGITQIYVSPLIRCRETAAIVAEKLGVTAITVEPDLIERDYGDMTGKPISAIPDSGHELLRSPEVIYFLDGQNVETFPQLYQRAERLLNRLRLAYPKETILLVAHNDIGLMLMAAARRLEWRQVLANNFIHNAEILSFN